METNHTDGPVGHKNRMYTHSVSFLGYTHMHKFHVMHHVSPYLLM